MFLGDILTVHLHSCGHSIKICVYTREFSMIIRGRFHSWEYILKMFNSKIIIIPTRL
jgi:hypothetical protein